MKRILLMGSNGQVGTDLQNTLRPLGHVYAFDRSALDVTQSDKLRSTIQMLKPEVIVNAAAYTAVDKAETEQTLCYAINSEAPRVMAEEAKKNNALLIHYSTDYVFNGQNNKPYVESDPVGPINVYGKSKLEGEKAIAQADCDYLILRTSWIYANRGKNFLLTMLKLAAERNELRIVGDQIGVPNWSFSLAEATASLISGYVSEKKGIYHVSCQGQASWFDFASEIFAAYKKHHSNFKVPQLHSITSAEYPTPAKRPHYSVLATKKMEKNFGITLPNWQTSLEFCLSRQT